MVNIPGGGGVAMDGRSIGGTRHSHDGDCEWDRRKAKEDARMLKGATTMLAVVAQGPRVIRSAATTTFPAATPWVATMNNMLHTLSYDSIECISSRRLLEALQGGR